MLHTPVYELAIDALCNDLNPEGGMSPATVKTRRKRKKEHGEKI
jgi:hypothetical protein